jgi:hypothetical protein
MPCYSPIVGYLSRSVNPTGKRSVVFDVTKGFLDMKVQLPCGRCIGCKLERSRQWAIRCVHEASLYPDNCFITLTFNDSSKNDSGSLVKSDFQKFMKRLRKKFGQGVRYFHCGEYGSKLGRPHHHACLFNFDFPDKVLYSDKGGNKLYISKSLIELWPFGFSTIGAVTFESAAYVARYIAKKITGDKAEAYYNGREPEYTTMSRRPGIGFKWFQKFKGDIYPHDFLVIRGGIKCKPPRFYDEKYLLTNPDSYDLIKGIREHAAKDNPDNRPRRLDTRRVVQEARFKELKRGYENVT